MCLSIENDRIKDEPPRSKKVEKSNGFNNSKEIAFMTAAMAILSGTYEILRSASTALITAETTLNVPLVMSLSTPFSFLLLVWYNYEMRQGPRHTLYRTSTVIGFYFLIASAILDNSNKQTPNSCSYPESIVNIFAGLTYLTCESCYHLLCTQYWSFISTIVTEQQGKTLFAPIGGVCSISGAITGSLVKIILRHISLGKMLGFGGLLLLVTVMFADNAYEIASHSENDEFKILRNTGDSQNEKNCKLNQSVLEKCRLLFQKEPILCTLACELVASQAFATILNISYMSKLKKSLPLDSDRASWTGKFYSIVNGFSGILQFAALPVLMSRVSQHNVWITIPSVMLGITAIGIWIGSSSLFADSISFGVMKIMEYSARGVAIELLYVALDSESRYAGKQMISTFGVKFARTLTSLVLTGFTSILDPNSLTTCLSWLKIVTVCIWLYFANRLATRIKSPSSRKKYIQKDI